MNDAATARMEDWLNKAHRAVATAFPTVCWDTETEDKRLAGETLDAILYAHFYEGSMSLDDVLVAWRIYYKSCIPF